MNERSRDALDVEDDGPASDATTGGVEAGASEHDTEEPLETASGASPSNDRGDLVASLWPWRGDESAADVEIVVYVVTGEHGGLTIPESFCRECHRFAHAADVAADRVDADVEVSVRSWWTHLPFALWHGGYHAPVMVVGGTRLCQGHDVPTPDEVVAAIETALQ